MINCTGIRLSCSTKIFHSFQDVPIAADGLQNFLCSLFDQGGIFIVPHLLALTLSLGYFSSGESPNLVALYDKQGYWQIVKCSFLTREPIHKSDHVEKKRFEEVLCFLHQVILKRKYLSNPFEGMEWMHTTSMYLKWKS